MAPKRHRGESSGSSGKFDKKRFVSVQAADRYQNKALGKSIIPERGLLPDDHDGEVAQMIRHRKWSNFTSQPGPAAIKIVKEFYSNVKEANRSLVMVRGKSVNVGRKAINAYYGLKKIRDSDYRMYMKRELDYSEVIEALCVPGTEWKLTDQQEAVHFPSSKLSRYGKAWHAFICAKLIPCRHMSDVINQRAALLFCIAKGKSVDVGEVIHESIMRGLDGGTSGGLPHPSLITELCRQAGVQWDDEEALQAPLAPINHSVMTLYKICDGAESHPRGLGFIIVPPVHVEQPIEQPPESPSSMPPPDWVENIRRDLQHHTRRIDLVATQIHQGFDRMDRQQSCLAQRQAEIYSHCTTSLADMFHRMNPAGTPYQFTLPPPLSVYPPPDLPPPNAEDEDAGEE